MLCSKCAANTGLRRRVFESVDVRKCLPVPLKLLLVHATCLRSVHVATCLTLLVAAPVHLSLLCYFAGCRCKGKPPQVRANFTSLTTLMCLSRNRLQSGTSCNHLYACLYHSLLWRQCFTLAALAIAARDPNCCIGCYHTAGAPCRSMGQDLLQHPGRPQVRRSWCTLQHRLRLQKLHPRKNVASCLLPGPGWHLEGGRHLRGKSRHAGLPQ
jgi:hypothetical protein